MAKLRSAKKHARQTKKRHAINVTRQTAIKTSIKRLLKAIDAKESPETVRVLFNDAQAKLARAKSKGLVHAKTAARTVSRLAHRITPKKA